MDELYLLLSSSDEENNLNQESVMRRQLRDSSSPLALHPKTFKKRFRLTKEAFTFILNELPNLDGHLSTSVPKELQLAATLSVLATGGYQHLVGYDYLIGMAQSTVSKYVAKVVDEMENVLCPQFIKFDPNSLESKKCKNWFMTKYQIPGVIGCVDGTHIGLQKPIQNEHMFFNRKGKHSINSMIICDYRYRINSINSKFGGAAHDSFVWGQSDERKLLEQLYVTGHNKNSWVLGDFGYPIEPWCITPYRSAADGSSEARFNEVHSKSRCIIERTIGILKGRWRILMYDTRGRYSPEKMAKYSNVCAALHNICVKYNILFEDQIENIEQHIGGDIQHSMYTTIGKTIRDQIKNCLLTN